MRPSSISLLIVILSITIGFGFLRSSKTTEGMEALGPFFLGIIILWGGCLIGGIMGLIVISQDNKTDRRNGAISIFLAVAAIIFFLIL